MSTVSVRDLELLSAYLDRELSQKDKTRLVARIVKDPDLAQALDELRQTRNILRRTPQRKAPRNFTLTPKMAGIRPPVPRVVPALSWASAIATVMFVCTLGYNFLSSGALGAAAPRAPESFSANQAAPATQPPATEAPAVPPVTLAPILPGSPVETATETPPAGLLRPKNTPTAQTGGIYGISPTETPTLPSLATPTVPLGMGGGPETSPTEAMRIASVPEATEQGVAGAADTGLAQKQPQQAFPWAYIWLGLAALCIGAALLIRWLHRLAFARKIKQ